MSLSSEAVVLRGQDAVRAVPAQLADDLRLGLPALGTERRPADPRLEKAFAAAVAEAREHAREQGFEAGFADGLRSAERLAQERADEETRRAEAARGAAATRLSAALGALDDAADQLRIRARARAEAAAEDVGRAAFELAKALLGRELAVATEPGMDAVRRVFAAVAADQPVTVRMNPVDHAAVAQLSTGTELRPGCRLIPDPAVPAGGAIGEHAFGRIDATLETAVERVRQVLAP